GGACEALPASAAPKKAGLDDEAEADQVAGEIVQDVVFAFEDLLGDAEDEEGDVVPLPSWLDEALRQLPPELCPVVAPRWFFDLQDRLEGLRDTLEKLRDSWAREKPGKSGPRTIARRRYQELTYAFDEFRDGVLGAMDGMQESAAYSVLFPDKEDCP